MHSNKKNAQEAIKEIFPPEKFGYKKAKKPSKSFLSPDLQKGLKEKHENVVRKEIEAKQLI